MASCGPWTKQCWTVWRRAPFCRASGSRPLDDRLTFGDQMANRVARFGGSWPLILVFVGVLGGMDRHERSGPAAAALRSLTIYPPQLDAVLRRHPAGANHHDEPAPAGNQEPPAGQSRYRINLKAELEIRQLHERSTISLPVNGSAWSRCSRSESPQTECATRTSYPLGIR